jgi:hypothetical protein
MSVYLSAINHLRPINKRRSGDVQLDTSREL